jgi:hypothetical protein
MRSTMATFIFKKENLCEPLVMNTNYFHNSNNNKIEIYLPATWAPQFNTYWMERLISSLLELVILMRSLRAERAPWAQL